MLPSPSRIRFPSSIPVPNQDPGDPRYGFDVPDFLAAGPRDVMVPQAGAEAARELLHSADLAPPARTAARPNPVKLVAAIALGGAGAALIAYLLQS